MGERTLPKALSFDIDKQAGACVVPLPGFFNLLGAQRPRWRWRRRRGLGRPGCGSFLFRSLFLLGELEKLLELTSTACFALATLDPADVFHSLGEEGLTTVTYFIYSHSSSPPPPSVFLPS
jgi:hypothetical protein